MALLAVFGITTDGLNLVVNLLLLFLVVFWLALVYWTLTDARRRIADPMLVGCATAASLFPFVGTIVYMIVRPPEYLEDVRERELEIAAAEVRLAAVESQTCSYCNYVIERSFLRCPSCLRRLKEPCTTCAKPLAPGWKICPYCESEIGQAPPRRRERPAAAPASGGQRRVAASGEQRAASAPGGERRPAAAGGQRQAAPAGDGAQRAPAARRRAKAATPAADGEAKRASSAPARAPAGRQPKRPSAGDSPKRSATPAAQRSVTRPDPDAVTAEQPAARPRTRPPSTG